MTKDSDIMSLITKAARSKDRVLVIEGQAIETLPPEIGSLSHLQELSVEGCELKSVPRWIGELHALQTLSFRNNRIESIPPEIGNLKELTKLDLAFNELTSLPLELGRLKKLNSINLFDNELSEFPSFWNCENGFAIHIGYNNICEIPASIGRLSKLEFLELGHNQVSKIAPEIATIPRLSTISGLESNPLPEPLPKLFKRGLPHLMAYFRGVLEAGIQQYEAKLLLVGEGNVGKSSLVAALHGDPFVSNRSTTHGIEITRLELPHPSLDEHIVLNTWDFGGQEVYRITHQFFFSRRCLYVLVWRPREGQEENAIEEWCRRIRLRVGDDARVLIVATHVDERRAELDYPYLQRQFGDTLVGHYEVDNLSGKGIAELRKAIAELASQLPQMGERISQRWIDVHNEIKTISQPQISYAKFGEISDQHAVGDDQKSALVGLLHDLGYIIHFGDDDGLRDIVVLQPEWLTKAIGYVLEDLDTASSQGILDHRRLASIWQNPARDTQYTRNCHSYFLRMMEKFDVSYRIPDEDRSLVAQLVPYEEPTLPWYPSQPLRLGERQLTLVCKMSDVAPGLLAWLTVRNHRFSTGMHWRRGVFLRYWEHQAEALLVQQTARELTLIVRAPSPDYFFSILRDSVESLIRLRWDGLSYEMMIPCPCVDNLSNHCTGQFELQTLQRYRERGIPNIRCTRCIEEQDVAELLTGFAMADAPLGRLLDAVNNRADEIRADLHMQTDAIKSHQAQAVASQAAELASQLRALMLAVGREMPDCPRLFTLVPLRERRLGRLGVWRHHFQLTLWCEHPGEEHPWPEAQYDFARPKQWLATIAPYVLVISTVLRAAVPIGGAALGLAISDKDYENIKKDLDLMKALVEHLPTNPMETKENLGLPANYQGAEGAELRALRTLLLELDPPMRFGDLRRVLIPSGDYLWICPRHYQIYDPGLPILP